MYILNAKDKWLLNKGLTPSHLTTSDYLSNPNNWGPPLPLYKDFIGRLGTDDLVKLYLEVDASSESGVSWRRELRGTTGPASKIRAGSPALCNLVTTTHKYASAARTSYAGTAFNRSLYASRVVYFLTYGDWPEVVDHIDNNPLNNNPNNLRASTHVKNAQNRKSGQTKGFYWNRAARKFYSRVAGVLVGCSEDMLTARADYIRAYLTKYNHLPNS